MSAPPPQHPNRKIPMYTFRAANIHPPPPPPPRRPTTRNMHAGKKPAVKSSRPQRAAAVRARNNSLRSNTRAASARQAPRPNVEDEIENEQPQPVHPFKKRMIRAWNDSSNSNKVTSPSDVSTPNTISSNTSGLKPPSSNRTKPMEKSQPAKNVVPPEEGPQPPTEGPQPQRRRYPKLLSVDKHGRMIANPLKLPTGPPPVPLVVPGDDDALHDSRDRPAPSMPPPQNPQIPSPDTQNNSLAGPSQSQETEQPVNPNQVTNVHPPSPVSLPHATVRTHTQPPGITVEALEAAQVASGQRRGGRKSSASTWRSVEKCLTIAPMPTFTPNGYPTLLPYPLPYLPGIAGGHIQFQHAAQHSSVPFSGVVSGAPVGTTPRNRKDDVPVPRGGPTQTTAQDQADAQMLSHSSGQPLSEAVLASRSRLPVGETTGRPNVEQVIQVGNRCGNQEYWRSSLQMPKSSRVKKAATKAKARLAEKRISHAVQTQEIPPVETVPASRAADARRLPMPLKIDVGQYERIQQRNVFRRERGLVDPNATRTPLDVGQHHEFWRRSTKLPSVSSDKARQRRLAEGKRRALDRQVKSPSTVTFGNQGETARQMNGTGRVPSDQVMVESEGAGDIVQGAPLDTNVGNPSASGVGERTAAGSHKTPQQFLDEEQEHSKKILRTKNYEERQMESYAESRFHVKMNLRGRNKLANWLSTDDVLTTHSVMFLVFMLDLDRRLMSPSPVERKQALEEMENDALRMLEALMTRLGTRDGYNNWNALTENFNLEQ